MTEKDWKGFASHIRAADEMQGLKPRSGAALLLMFEALAGYELDNVKRAVTAHAATSPYLVKLSDITRYFHGDPNERSEVAWRTFLRAVENYGYWDSVQFPNPAFHYVIEQLGGWMKLCEAYDALSEKELHFRAKEWRQLYEVGERVASWGDEVGKMRVLPYLVGFFEADNRAKNFLEHIPPVIEIASGRQVWQDELCAGEVVLPIMAKTGTEAS